MKGVCGMWHGDYLVIFVVIDVLGKYNINKDTMQVWCVLLTKEVCVSLDETTFVSRKEGKVNLLKKVLHQLWDSLQEKGLHTTRLPDLLNNLWLSGFRWFEIECKLSFVPTCSKIDVKQLVNIIFFFY